jgi:DNA-binding NarL/FixJ family response regulator
MKLAHSEDGSPKRIFIVEDHPIFRMGLMELIQQENDMIVCGSAEDVKSACNGIKALKPDLAIVDLSLKKSNGFELLRKINDENSGLPVLVLSMHDEQIHAERCLHAGAQGYINKKEASESVITAIRQILKGNIFLSKNMTTAILNKFHNNPSHTNASPLKSLTSREFEVFYLIGRGMISADIAKQLHLSVKTIGTHKERIKEKLGLKHSAELVRYAVLWVEKEGLQEPLPGE